MAGRVAHYEPPASGTVAGRVAHYEPPGTRDSYGGSSWDRGDRGDSRERPRADLGPPRASGHDDRDGHRGQPRGVALGPPRREAGRHDDFRDSQRPIPTERGEGRGDHYVNDYPPRADAGYGHRDDYAGGRPGGREYRAQGFSGDRGPEAGYSGGRDYPGQDYTGAGRGEARGEAHMHPPDMSYRGAPGPVHDEWARGAGNRGPDQRMDRRPVSPPRAARGAAETDDFRGAYASPAAGSSERDARDGRAAMLGSRLDALPPTDLRRSLVRDVPPASSTSTGSHMASSHGAVNAASNDAPQHPHAAALGGAPPDGKVDGVHVNGELISQVEAARRRKRDERFRAERLAANQVACCAHPCSAPLRQKTPRFAALSKQVAQLSPADAQEGPLVG